MSRVIRSLTLALCLAPVPVWAGQAVSPHDSVHTAPAPSDTLTGSWRVDDGDPTPIVIRRSKDGYLLARADRWIGSGRLDGNRYAGEFESQRTLGDTTRVAGLHQGTLAGEGRLDVTVIYTHGRHGARHEVWHRVVVSDIAERARIPRGLPAGSRR